MKQTLWAMVMGAGLMAAAYAGSLSTAQADGAGTCGGKGQTPCPLQGWMEKNMQTFVDKNDAKGLAPAFEKVAKLVPDPKWNTGDPNWAAISKTGADAAKAGDIAAVKATCKSCHKAFRDKYKAEHRMKPVS